MRAVGSSDAKALQALQSSLGHALHGRNENWRRALSNRLRKNQTTLAFSLCDRAKRVKNLAHKETFLSFEASIGAEKTEAVEMDLPGNERAF
jgi:hypothetical protein